MAFSMKVAQGAVTADKCPHMTPEALAKLAEATEPPMKTISVGEHKLGGETVMLRHEKLFVSKRSVKAVVLVDARKHVHCQPITEHNYEV
jgi:acetyl-CoA decarbonylase/synthase complex subunit gamma